MHVILEPEEFELVAHRARPDIPVQAVNSRSEGAIRRARSRAEHPRHRWVESQGVFRRLASVPPLVRAPAGDQPAPKEAITAALLVIGDKILSGRTKDQNIGYVVEYLTALGMHLAEVRVIG